MSASTGREGRLSRHFTAAEFRCSHCHAAVVTPQLIRTLEYVRAHINKPLPIVSGYRCPIHNAAVGGAENSQHMYGTAADIPLGLVTPAVAAHAGAVGIGVQGEWVRHLDVRDGPRARWSY